ncbi:MAG: asparagine synthase (glutamine-hydrolyzing) [Myxococcales bacterium]|nr:asparagine synthase (glutamine-hydrolyzing) [Myxococcales bacterium]
MCGIAGIFHTNGAPIQSDLLELMTNRLRHRGPDSHGTKSFGHVGLAHTRLQIIDLSEHAAQPLANENGSIWVVFNGEIYDHQHHRRELIAKGHIFRSQSDTEIIVHTYEESGLSGLARLNGMFAYALWDHKQQRLMLARDRTGQKPLFVYENQQKIAFASEIKAILSLPGIDTSINPFAIPQYLSHGYVPAPDTFYKKIYKLDPGTFHIYTKDTPRPTVHSFWSIPATYIAPPNIDKAAHEVRDKLESAVVRRMVADVPLGAFVSGGVDSSIIVGLMSRNSQQPIKTFCLGFPDHPNDERLYARKVAEFYGTTHIELTAQTNCFTYLPELLSHMDEPFGDTSLLPTALICQLARQHTSVVITGDGGDELFAGYPRFSSASYPAYIPKIFRQNLSICAKSINKLKEPTGLTGQVLRFIHRMEGDASERLHSWIAIFRPHELNKLMRARYLNLPSPGQDSTSSSSQDQDLINTLLRINAKTYLQEDLNVKIDRSSMYYGLEARSPFLDMDLIDYTFRLPGSYKIHWGQRKYLLRKAFSELVPNWVFRRKKMGFGLPLGQWFQGPLRELVEDTLSPSRGYIYDSLNIAPVRKLLDEHMTGKRDRSYQIWALLALELWMKNRHAATEHNVPQTPITTSTAKTT